MTSLHLFALTASRRPNYFFNPAFANTGPWSRAPTRSMSGSRITVASIFFPRPPTQTCWLCWTGLWTGCLTTVWTTNVFPPQSEVRWVNGFAWMRSPLLLGPSPRHGLGSHNYLRRLASSRLIGSLPASQPEPTFYTRFPHLRLPAHAFWLTSEYFLPPSRLTHTHRENPAVNLQDRFLFQIEAAKQMRKVASRLWTKSLPFLPASPPTQPDLFILSP